MSPYEKAEQLALARGCVPENPCWDQCFEVALEAILAVVRSKEN